jgi:hypothetical protein
MADEIPEEARNDYDALLQALLPFAEEMLKKHGEFYPFAMAMTTQGEVSAHMTYDGKEMPEPAQVLANLNQVFQEEAREGKVRATGICSDGRISLNGKETDAIIATLEHVSGEACKACVPYKKGLFGGYKFGQISVGRAEPKVFTRA